ncbi:VIN3-like protein 2 [Mercurialis annua]|uniref:VIN3-like protein 2 n=1 Tax=Mercurialis annua TaxID=3986 RepID=UPI00215F9B64|nr:VIN3-like protein 2 [Mercurialis annua]XP_050217016.1 VIN3-like protein 2 [Mercurialis annua]
MDLSVEGSALDPSKCTKLSMDEKREFVYQLSKCSGASEKLQSWSRQEILQILCVEMGKERKYTGLTKLKIIEHLLRIVSEKKAGECDVTTDAETEPSPASVHISSKRQRKTDNPSRITVSVNYNASSSGGNDLGNTVYCKNSACRAVLKQDAAFCKRCSCCICYKYDDNKDPSLWLTCSSEPPFQAVACGMSCHLDCALKHENTGIGKDGHDGSFRCIACWKVNDLLGCWRKQLLMAKDTRRVDILCYRVSLSQKLLNRTGKYKKLYEIVDEAAKQLEDEVGPLTGLPVKMGRGIVNRLSSGPEVQKLCAFALESLDKILSSTVMHPFSAPIPRDLNATASTTVRIEGVNSTSLAVVFGSENNSPDTVIGYTLWHRKAEDTNYPVEPTCMLFVPNTRFVVTGLYPATKYNFKAVSFNDIRREMSMCEVQCCTLDEVPNCSGVERSQSPVTNCSSLSNPSSMEDETNHNAPCRDQIVNRADDYPSFSKGDEKTFSANQLNGIVSCDGAGDGRTLADTSTIPLLAEEHDMPIVTSAPACDVNKHSQESQIVDETSTENGSDTPIQVGLECVPFVSNMEASLPITPCKLEMIKDVQGRHGRSKSSNKDLSNGNGKGEEAQDRSTSKKRNGERRDEECMANAHSDRDLEYYIKVIRWLECEGHIEKNFRQKFLTWYSLRATPQEVRVVKVFVDTFIQDPASLAEQLVDTFSECVSSRNSSTVPAGFCMKLWH